MLPVTLLHHLQPPIAVDRTDNLYRPVPGDYAAHGEFDRQAHGGSIQLWVTMHRKWLLLGGGLLAGVLIGAGRLSKNGHADSGAEKSESPREEDADGFTIRGKRAFPEEQEVEKLRT